ncbi:hypothetical protein GOBAR_DD35557 [Gossypium barbadense]|nr:hypothetical protein GOBAR_DD35557 [Gossypium barbadense]
MEREKKQSSAVSDIGAWALNVVSSVGLIMANKQLITCWKSNKLIGAFYSDNVNRVPLLYDWHNRISVKGQWLHHPKKGAIMGTSLVLHCRQYFNYWDELEPYAEFSWILSDFKAKYDTGRLCDGMDPPWETILEQSIGSLQKKYAIGSFELLSQTAPIQAVSLLLLGPFVDYFLTGNLLPTYHLSSAAFPISLHRTVLRGLVPGFRPHENGFLILGWLLFDSELTFKNILGMAIAVLGMLLYSWAIEADKAAPLPKHGSDHVKLLLKQHEVDGSSPVKDVELGVGGLSRG